MVTQLIACKTEHRFDTFKPTPFEPDAGNSEAKRTGVAVAEFLFGFRSLFDGEVLRDDTITAFVLDRAEDLHCAIVVQAAPEEKQAAVRVAILEQLGDGPGEINTSGTVGFVIVLSAKDALSRRFDVAVQLDDGNTAGICIDHYIQAVDDLEAVLGASIEGLFDEAVVVGGGDETTRPRMLSISATTVS